VTETRKERKVLTCLFCDLVGFTARAETLDPEDVEAVLRPYHERLRSDLERHGGTVEKFIGDAVMALFGAPTAHEDDPERAVRAALAIRDWAREEGELEVRIGITTGEALVSLGARPEAGEGMASGDVVNTASRLQAAAPTNGVLVDETTYRATEQAIDYRGVEPVEAKGKTEPLPVWEPLEPRALIGVELQSQTPLVGRERERDLLVDALDRVRRESSPQLVTLVGVPGIGKSRLVAELFGAVERDPELITWRHGRSLPYGEGVAFWAFAEMVKAQAGVLNSDTEEVATRKLHDAVAAAMDGDDASWVEARLQPLLGLGDRAEDRDESFGAWRRFVEALAEQRPTVLVFEDLHWADDDVLDFADYLVDWVTGVPLLVVGTARPELLDRRPDWGGGKRNASTVSLAPLDDVETAKLISALLERAVLPAETQEKLLQRAGGNPLYAEQFARMLAERGDAGELPETVQGIIAARLDALTQEEKALLQDASVIGKLFWTGALEAVSGVDAREAERLLHGLERKEFVRRERRSSVEGETEHSFAHLLVRDVAYSQIPRALRAERHLAAAEWIESLGRAEDRAELLAHHYLAALELGRAAGVDTSPIKDRARDAFREAGDRATSLNSFALAERFYKAALELAPEDDPQWPHLVLRLEHARRPLAGEEDIGAIERAIAILISVDDIESAAEAETYLSDALHGRGDVRGAGEHVDQALALIRDKPPSAAKAAALAQRSKLSMLAGQRDAIDVGREALAIADQLGLDELRATLLNTIGAVRTFEGDWGGLEDLKQSLVLALEVKSPGEIQRSHNNLMEAYRRMGNWPEASRTLAENRKAIEGFGILGPLRWVRAEEAHDAYYTGNWDASIAAADDVLSQAEGAYLEPVVRALRAKIRFARGDQQGADEDATRGVELAADSDPQVLSTALGYGALLLLEEGKRTEALDLLDKVLKVPAYIYAVVDVAFLVREFDRGQEIHAWLADFGALPWAFVGEAIAGGDLSAAADALEEMGNVADEAYVRLRSGTDRDVRRALGFYRSVEATRYVREGEALLAESA
jgi:class 3 adenylate cyclase/tetratricopeptide (TPR) repeat protein